VHISGRHTPAIPNDPVRKLAANQQGKNPVTQTLRGGLPVWVPNGNPIFHPMIVDGLGSSLPGLMPMKETK
jgi:hypothetical protein